MILGSSEVPDLECSLLPFLLGLDTKGPFRQIKRFDFSTSKSPNCLVLQQNHSLAGPLGAGDLAELGTQYTFKT